MDSVNAASPSLSMQALAESTSGPVTPKWAKSISPICRKTARPSSYTVRVTFRGGKPARAAQHSSAHSSGTSEGRGGVTVCPSARARAYPAPSEPVAG